MRGMLSIIVNPDIRQIFISIPFRIIWISSDYPTPFETMATLPPDHFVKHQQFTPKVYRDVYPAIEPTQASLSQKGKVVIVTGASQGLGARVR